MVPRGTTDRRFYLLFKKILIKHQSCDVYPIFVYFFRSDGFPLVVHFLNQCETKFKSIVTRSRVTSRAFRWLHACNCFDWFTALFPCIVVGQSNCFGLGSRLAMENHSPQLKP